MVLDFTFEGSGCDRCTLDCFQSSMPSPTQTYIMKDSDKYKSCCLEEVFTNLAENFYNCKRTFYQKKQQQQHLQTVRWLIQKIT